MRPFSLLVLSFLLMVSGTSPAAPVPRLVKDIATGQTNVGSSPESYQRLGDIVLFAAESASHGRELWKTDGTPEGTVMVKDICKGATPSNPGGLIEYNGLIYFVANDGVHGAELWRTDGTPEGTTLFRDSLPGPASGGFYYHYVFDGHLYYSSTISLGSSQDFVTWKTDGTPEGTVPWLSDSQKMTSHNGELYFTRSTPETGTELWKSDGTAEGSSMVMDFYPGTASSNPDQLTSCGDFLYFTTLAPEGGGNALWKTDGTPAGTSRILAPGNPYQFQNLTAFQNQLFFSARTAATGIELWKSDGTHTGTVMVTDISPGPAYSGSPEYFFIFKDALYFRASGPQGAYSLWKTDGTTEGTTFVIPGPVYGHNITISGNLFYFISFSSDAAISGLWRSDGTPGGTIRINPEGTWNPSSPWAAGNGSIYFSGFDPTRGNELWKSDGTLAGTGIVKDIHTGGASLKLDQLVVSGDRAYFRGLLGGSFNSLWTSGGDSESTYNVSGTNEFTQIFLPSAITPASGERALFKGNKRFEDTKLWSTDGTTAIPQMIQQNSPTVLGVIHETTYYSTSPYNGPRQLWKSDGTVAGTSAVPLVTGLDDKLIVSVTGTASRLFLRAYQSSMSELWTSDGTTAGTLQLPVVDPQSSYTSLSHETMVGEELYFILRSTNLGTALWKSDGTPSGTRQVKALTHLTGDSPISSMTAVNGRLFFIVSEATYGAELWVSDGTEDGTSIVRDIRTGPAGGAIANLTPFLGEVYFSANDGSSGIELWKSDGTPGGTTMVKDIVPGPGSSHISSMVRSGNALYFAASDDLHGEEVWISDGTEAGTRLLHDLVPGPDSSSPQHITAAIHGIYYSAHTQETGREIYYYDPTPPPVVERAEPTDLAPYSVTLHGQVHASGATTRVQVEYWVEGSPPVIAEISLSQPGSIGEQDFSHHLALLEQNTHYLYRFTATNRGGTTSTPQASFTTPKNDPPIFTHYRTSTLYNSPVEIPWSTLKALASDPDGDAFSITTFGDYPWGGEASSTPETLTFTPWPGFNGTGYVELRFTDARGGVSFGFVTIEVSGPFGFDPPPAGLIHLAAKRKQLNFTAIPGRTYELQRSTDLEIWTVIDRPAADSTGKVEFIDEDAPEDSAFYRLAVP